MEKLLWVPMRGGWCGNAANKTSGGIVMESVGYGRAKKTASKEAGKWGTNLEERAGVRTNSVLTEFERMFPSGLDALGMPMPTLPAIMRPRSINRGQ